jgi:CubicO group peptidase (beta-lactamase class C family)
MKKQGLIFVSMFWLLCHALYSQNPEIAIGKLKKQLLEVIKPFKGSVGVALIHFEKGDTLTINEQQHYPMQSVFKFPLALAILDQVDKKKISLKQKVHVSKEDLRPATWSPLTVAHPEGNLDVTVAELLEYTVSKSDNNTCDILFKLAGGTAYVNDYIHRLGVKNIAISATEYEMTKAWEVQYTNWTRPFAMSELLKGFYEKKYLSDSCNRFLMKLMTESSNSPNRIKGLLPQDIEVAHKTGTSDTNEKGVQAAVNDVGIIKLENGDHVALSVFVANSTEKIEAGEKLIAEISKTVFDFYPTNPYFNYMRIDSLLSAKTSKPFSGQVYISRNGKAEYSKTSGFSELETKTPLQTNAQFCIGSVSKQFTAVLVLQEYDKGHLKLDVPVRQYLPELSQSWADTVTIHHLLTHTHGITALDKPATFKAGTKFSYSQLGYELLAKLIEKISGKSFAQLSAELFSKCNMTHTFHPGIKKYDALVKGYSEQENGNLKFEMTSLENHPAAGAFISTAPDLALWNEQLHTGKLLKPETYAIMTSRQPNALREHPLFGRTAYGYGITITDTEQGLQFGQTGYAPGFVSMNFYFTKTKTSLIILQNIAYETNDLKKTFYYALAILNIITHK